MVSSRRKGSARAAAAAATAARQQWKVGDLVLAKMKGFPAWPAMISEPEKWGFSSDRKKLLVYFYGTKQIAFCNYADIEAFTEEKKKSLLIKRQGKGADFVRAVEEIIGVYESLKKQSLARDNFSDGGNNGNALNKEPLEDVEIICFGKTVEPSLTSSPNHHLEGATLTECGDMGNVDYKPGVSLDFGKHKKNAVVDDSAQNISILDQLRNTSMSSIPTTRKRARDALLPSSVTKSTSSLRRSRSSLVNKPCKSQKSSMQVNVKVDASYSAPDILLEKSAPKEQVVKGEHLVTCCAEASSIATGVPIEKFLAIKSEETSLDDGNVLEFSGKFECYDNDTASKTFPDADVRVISKDGIPSNTMVIKARKKPYKKQLTNARAWGGMDMETDVQTEGCSLSDSSNSRNGITDKFSNADGDGHLPLVKRARIRMSEQPVKEEGLNEDVQSKVKLADFVTSNGHYESTSFSSIVNNCTHKTSPLKGPSPVAKGVGMASTNGSFHNNTEKSLLSSKVNTYHLMLDVEAALPPSKRLHRALEAMSANAAEAATDCPQAQSETDQRSCDWLGSTENMHCVAECVKCPMKPLHLQFSGRSAVNKSACSVSSSQASQDLAVYCLTSSEVKPDDSNSEIVTIQKNSEDIITERSCNHTSFSSKVSGDSKTSSLELVKKHCSECGPNNSLSPLVEENDRLQLNREFMCSEAVRVSPKETASCNSQQLTGLSPSGGTATAFSTTSVVCSASEIDGGAAGLYANIDSSATDMNVIPSVSSGTNVFSLPSCMNGAAAVSVATNFSSTTNENSMAAISSRSNIEQSYRVRDMQNVVLEVKKTLKDRSILSKLAPIKDLIAAAQAKRVLSRSSSSCDSVVDGMVAPDSVVSPKLINKEDTSGHGSLSNPMFYHRSATDDGTFYLQNGSKTPLDGSSKKVLSKYMNHSEANAARRSFESMLCTLSRTKESIGRATRLAIDCAKYGIAGEVIDILLQNLEKESSLHRRVDLFFLVDSITQCSRWQKGGPGDVYPSLVQAVLPRLLSAAAPPGNTASENRRQCLKVLRLWLERRTLPEFTVRHHIKELEYGSEASLSISYSRRPPRTERPLNDPVREMEGMLVDEYGSNASFQLPQFLNTRILEDDDGSASDGKSFEAVTPDTNAEIDERGTTPISANKHHLVLEDVDGELEMEDVAPSCGQESGQSTCYVKGTEMMSNCNSKCKQNDSLSLAPPLPEERPPSPPPLPSSPPPVPMPCSALTRQAPHTLAGLTASTDNADFNLSGTSHTPQNQLLQPISQQKKNLHCSSSLSESASYSQGYVSHPQQMPQLVSSCTSSGSYGNLGSSQPAKPVGNSSLSTVNVPSTNKVYHLQPPPPVLSNQFSYIQAQPQHRPQALGNQSSYSDRFHHAHDVQRSNFFGDGASIGPVQVDASDRSAFYPSVLAGSMGLAPDQMEAPHAPALYGPHLDQSSAPSQDWSYPSRTSSYPIATSRPTLEKSVSGVAGASPYWRAR